MLSAAKPAIDTSGSVAPSDGVRAFDLFAPIPDGWRLESGDRLGQAEVRARIHGPEGAPVVVVAGGISSGRCPYQLPDGGRGWWAQMVRPGGVVDLDRLQVLAFDFAPDGDSAPITLTTRDQARLLAIVLDHAGVDRVAAYVGSSYGGMVGLAFAELFPERVERLAVICAAHRSHPMTTAVRGIQRRILAFAASAGRPEEGVALARELAMTTYRSPEEFDARFKTTAPARAGDPYPVCDYLIAQGLAYPSVTTPARWTTLSDSMDRHDVDPAKVTTPTTLVGFTSDRLAPIEDIRVLAKALPNLDWFAEIPSVYGHDGFLKETEALAPILRAVLPAAQTIAA
jgi:homoserine O-acetyltransferase